MTAPVRRIFTALLAGALLLVPSAPAWAAGAFAVNQGSGTVSQYGFGADGGLVPGIVPAVPAGAGARDLVVSPDGTSVYVVNQTANTVSSVDLSADGLLTPKGTPVPTGPGPRSVALTPDGTSAYVLNAGSISQYSVGAGGLLAPKAPATVSALGAGVELVPTRDSTSVFTSHPVALRLGLYTVAPTGELTPKTPPSLFDGGIVNGLAISPDGGVLYLANGNGTVGIYRIGRNGSLTGQPFAGAPVGAGDVAVSPDGENVYVTGGTALQVYAVSGGGAVLTSLGGVGLPAGAGTGELAISPDGASLYVPYGNLDAVGQFNLGPTGLVSPKTPATVPAGDAPTAIAVAPDLAPPTVSIATPVDGATYVQGAVVAADFACSDGPGGSGVVECTGDVLPGGLLDTTTPGFFAFIVTARDASGNVAVLERYYEVVAPAAARGAQPGVSGEPLVGGRSGGDPATGGVPGVASARARVTALSAGTRCLRAATLRRRGAGRFGYRLSAPGTVRLTVQRTGALPARRCRDAGGRAAAKDVEVGPRGSLRRASTIGRVAGRKLPPGTYRLRVATVDSTGRAISARRLTFWVVGG